jgi:hypothetical protein
VLYWNDVYPVVTTILKDEVPAGSQRPPRYAPDDVIDWWNNAQVRLATMKPRRRFQLFTSDDGAELPLPTWFYKPVGVFPYGNKESLPRLNISSQLFSSDVYGYYIYDDKLCLTTPEPPARWVFLYEAYYPAIAKSISSEAANSRVYVPEWAIEACAMYVSMQAVTREMIADAKYRKFTSPEDAGGNPTHNPYLPVAKWLKDRFYEIIGVHVDDDKDS